MAASQPDDSAAVLVWRVRIPEHVVLRDFPEETVVLNLVSGMYHGLNRTAARMLKVLTESPTVAAAAEELAREFSQPAERIRTDVLGLCQTLHERGLIIREPDEPPGR